MRIKAALVMIAVMIFAVAILIFFPRIFAKEDANKNTYHFIFKTSPDATLHNSAIEFLRDASDALGIAEVHMEVKDEDVVILTYKTEIEPGKILEVIQPDKLSVPLTLLAIFKGERFTPLSIRI